MQPIDLSQVNLYTPTQHTTILFITCVLSVQCIMTNVKLSIKVIWVCSYSGYEVPEIAYKTTLIYKNIF